jgi:hypothetical protein
MLLQAPIIVVKNDVHETFSFGKNATNCTLMIDANSRDSYQELSAEREKQLTESDICHLNDPVTSLQYYIQEKYFETRYTLDTLALELLLLDDPSENLKIGYFAFPEAINTPRIPLEPITLLTKNCIAISEAITGAEAGTDTDQHDSNFNNFSNTVAKQLLPFDDTTRTRSHTESEHPLQQQIIRTSEKVQMAIAKLKQKVQQLATMRQNLKQKTERHMIMKVKTAQIAAAAFVPVALLPPSTEEGNQANPPSRALTPPSFSPALT